MGLDAESGDGVIDPWFSALSRRFRTVNLFEEYPGPRWPKGEAELAAEELMILDAQGGRSGPWVLLGRRVAEACGFGGAAYFDWLPGGTVVIPHPSGLSRLLNDPVIRKALGDTLWEAIRRADLGMVGSSDG